MESPGSGNFRIINPQILNGVVSLGEIRGFLRLRREHTPVNRSGLSMRGQQKVGAVILELVYPF